MISTSNVALNYGTQKLFDNVNVKFTPGNCYGLIGANGSGKSTFIKILSGDEDGYTGQVIIPPGMRLSLLKQDHFEFDEYLVLDTVLMGNKKLYAIMKEKDALYAKEDFTDADGILASELEGEFGEMNGWEAESEASTILAGLGIEATTLEKTMGQLAGPEKVKVLLAQALFGDPEILLLDEPTNHLDIQAISWLENFLLGFKNTVIVVSHDRHFLNKVCTHIADIDFKKITSYTGNYAFWRQASEIAVQLRSNQQKKNEEKAKDLKEFIQRFSANASKSKQATARKNQLEKLELKDMPISTRKYPFVNFEADREAGDKIVSVEGICKTIEGEELLKDVSFTVNKNDKIVFLGNDLAKTTLFRILMGEIEPDAGTFEWGITTTQSFFPRDNSSYFTGDMNLVDWLRQFSKDPFETTLRGFLGKMLFTGDEALKKSNVLSGGEKVRCMLSKMMLSGANVLILDGPTNHLDLESITAVNDGLIRFKGTILFTSHDHQFNQTIANRIIDLRGKTLKNSLDSYDEYLKL